MGDDIRLERLRYEREQYDLGWFSKELMRVLSPTPAEVEYWEGLVRRQKHRFEELEKIGGIDMEQTIKKLKESGVEQFTRIVGEMSETYTKKNADYGDSFNQSLDEDGLIVSKVRIGDKYRRFGTLIDQEAQVKEETIRDTLLDMASYAIMTVMWMEAKGYENSK